MTHNRRELARMALEKSVEVRDNHDYDFRSPVCIYNLCVGVGVKVRFLNSVSMEGVYVAPPKPAILLSSLRPLYRRAFTCAHELGHHVFQHGGTIDEIKEDAASKAFQPAEFLVDTFAGFILMPVQAVSRAFSVRGLSPNSASPEEMYRIACSFGVGYETLLCHLHYSLGKLEEAQFQKLIKIKLASIRRTLLGEESSNSLFVADYQHAIGTLDVEVGSLILLPTGVRSDSAKVKFLRDFQPWSLLRAERQGLARVSSPNGEWGLILRISRPKYEGLAVYRHLEDPDDDELTTAD